jgi:hypothetical protein
MSTEWLVIKYLPDLRRREPENIGVVLFSDNGRRLRFRGQDSDGAISGARARYVSDLENLRQWARYLEWSLGQSNVTAESLVGERPGDNYVVTFGGRLLLGESPDPDSFILELYNELVAKPEDLAERFSSRVDVLIRETGLPEDPNFKMGWTGHTQREEEVSFPYAWVNGHVTIGALLPTLRTDLVQRHLWLFTNLPDTNKIVFTEAIPENLSKTAEILEAEASLLVVPESTPEDVRDRFLADSPN